MSQKFKDCISLTVITFIGIAITAFLSPTNIIIVSCLLGFTSLILIILVVKS